MHPHAQLIQNFYTSFQRRDAAGMIACYHPEVVFFDPVFMRLEGARAGAMWQMLCGRAKDLEITFSNVRADDQTGAAHWEAIYTFSKKGPGAPTTTSTSTGAGGGGGGVAGAGYGGTKVTVK